MSAWSADGRRLAAGNTGSAGPPIVGGTVAAANPEIPDPMAAMVFWRPGMAYSCRSASTGSSAAAFLAGQ